METTKQQDNEYLVRRMFDEVWNDKRPDKIEAYHDEAFVSHGFGSETGGLADYEDWYELMVGAFPDITFEIEDVFEADDVVAATWTATGTHEGELLGIEPTEKTGTVSGISLYRVEDGTFVEGWMQFDALRMLRLFGLIPAF